MRDALTTTCSVSSWAKADPAAATIGSNEHAVSSCDLRIIIAPKIELRTPKSFRFLRAMLHGTCRGAQVCYCSCSKTLIFLNIAQGRLQYRASRGATSKMMRKRYQLKCRRGSSCGVARLRGRGTRSIRWSPVWVIRRIGSAMPDHRPLPAFSHERAGKHAARAMCLDGELDIQEISKKCVMHGARNR